MTLPERYQHHEGTGLGDIILERQHQIDLGYTVEHDLERYTPDQLFHVASCYMDLSTVLASGETTASAWGEDEHPLWDADTGIPWTPEATAQGNAIKSAAFVAAALDLMHALEMENS